MILSEQAIKEFQQLWSEEFGEKISEDKAREEGNKLLTLIKLIYSPLPNNKLNKPKHEKRQIND